MSKQSLTLRDLLASVINDGGTVNTTSTATDLVRSVITEGTIQVPWSSTAITHDISGYTIESSVEGATLYPFYVNTGATMITLATGDTLLNTYVSGSTVVPTGVTVTEIITVTTGTTTQVNNFLNIQISGGTTGGSGSTTGTLIATDYLYFGDSISDGSWRMAISGSDLIIQRKISGTWTTKSTITG